MLPSPPEASRNKQEYFPDSTRTPSLPASFPWRWYDFLQAAQIVLSEYANSPRAWFAAAQPGTQAVFLPINTCLIDSSFPHVPKKNQTTLQVPQICLLLSLEPEAPAGAGARFMPRTQAYHHMLPSLPAQLSSRPYLLHRRQGADHGSHAGCLHKGGGNSSPGVSCFGSVA